MAEAEPAPRTAAEVDEHRRTGVVSADQYLALLQDCRDDDYWHRWAMRALLVLGAAHFLAGVVFFFAYNWDDLSAFAKFGLLEFAIAASFVAALALGIGKPGGQALLIAASVFTGVLLAVIGQTYQTGADAWELFAAWTALIVPWVLASRSASHWFLWIILFVTAVALYGQQRLIALGRVEAETFAAIVAILPAVCLAVREFALRQGFEWLGDSWFRRALVLLSSVALFALAIAFVFGNESNILGFSLFVLFSMAAWFVYTNLFPDFSVIAIIAGFITLVAMAIGGRVIYEVIGFGDNALQLVFALFLLGGWCAVLTSGAVRLLNSIHRRMTMVADDE